MDDRNPSTWRIALPFTVVEANFRIVVFKPLLSRAREYSLTDIAVVPGPLSFSSAELASDAWKEMSPSHCIHGHEIDSYRIQEPSTQRTLATNLKWGPLIGQIRSHSQRYLVSPEVSYMIHVTKSISGIIHMAYIRVFIFHLAACKSYFYEAKCIQSYASKNSPWYIHTHIYIHIHIYGRTHTHRLTITGLHVL